MAAPKAKTKPTPSDYQKIAAQFEAAKRVKAMEDAAAKIISGEKERASASAAQREALEARRKSAFERRWLWTSAFWLWMLCVHAAGLVFFTSGFLLTRLVLDEKSSCAAPPLQDPSLSGLGTVESGCWHPKTFDRAVVVLIDALRYDFTVPVADNAEFHNAFPFLYETAVAHPERAFLRPFIADPPTTTLQRLQGLTTGTLPTFFDMSSNFAGTEIEEDNLLFQLRSAGKKIVHLGDDTWTALFPDYFEANISRAYDSFNVWDLHTVDNGVLEHIFPLMEPGRSNEWDVLIGHCLGVDHAGHRYGPAHPAMTEKLQQMDGFIRKLAATIDDKTLLIVMGDHGMDSKGDHGGESDDEIEAALWMYSSRPAFGRTKPEFATPPATAKTRRVNQIDLVPTFAFLLGIPIPFNSLGWPIEEAFTGKSGVSWSNLAAVSRMTAAGIKRYQASYFAARGIEQAAGPGSPAELYAQAEQSYMVNAKKQAQEAAYRAYTKYQEETLSICKDLWARFDIPSMILGIAIMAFGVAVLLIYISTDEEDDMAVLEDTELELAEKKLELEGASVDMTLASHLTLHRDLVRAAIVGAVPAFAAGAATSSLVELPWWYAGVSLAVLASLVTVTIALFGMGKRIVNLFPTTVWGWLAVVFTVSQSVGFASNSFTIWEDSILLFFLGSFGLVSAISAFRLPKVGDRALAVYHSVLFAVLGRLASFSKLCREEQMPYCTSTYYASATSSTSAPWQLVIPVVVFLALPSIIKAYYQTSKSYDGLAPAWIGYVFRTVLFMSAGYWFLDAADNSKWFSSAVPEGTLKTVSVYVAQVVLALAVVAGSTAFAWAPPCVSIHSFAAPGSNRAQVTVLGYGNAHGARYLLLLVNVLAACLLLTKPVGSGALALELWQVLSLAELLDLLSLSGEAVGPVVLALLANYYYFKTGHQATMASIQWDSAFVPLFTIRYPWSPLVVVLNTFAGQIVAAVAVPLLVLWKVGPKRRGLLEAASRALAAFVAYFAVESLATMCWAGHLRRHLMLYRVFSPRFMMAGAVLLLVDVVALAVALTGLRSNTQSVSEVFGWAE
ncbi:uncharacterized protein E0L32_004248 [Thyridium curvatum]|uniref:Uncharacterized protein n=1 Tax=Thyridium curvatum TaxID=1093900 RepID=A0A507BG72_9PEZI|nr:uncharacterized protein E0L32_004248 [Thyridium curvatum]TPX15550.1 hypothetical protein E0L32_004248 [Thyridium curvatum]